MKHAKKVEFAPRQLVSPHAYAYDYADSNLVGF